MSSPLPTDLAALGNRINVETRPYHQKIDKQVTLKFAIAVRDPKVYRQGIQLFYHLFKTIEECLSTEIARDSKYSAMLRDTWKPELARTDKLYSDLMFFYQDHPEKFVTPMIKQQIESCAHIRQVTSEKPYLLLAYLHVLYLALFAGGRIMSSQVAKSLKLFPQMEGRSVDEVVALGTNLFRFDVNDPQSLRIVFKSDYDLQTRNFLSESEKQDVIEESKLAFEITADGIKEIERHNLKRLQSKLSYQIVTNGRYLALLVVTLVGFWFARRIMVHILYM
ncbi:DEKNAAC105188 [Brettanomyces naardenensis]|uniref:DEKNAAC105188 n=1 Tax=Brettanomyces naardenensis TaxID=13370 RepID=A0A448YT31_BRENA|nr:DEKNAAC105188 [Brettanomyces naardenensis]